MQFTPCITRSKLRDVNKRKERSLEKFGNACFTDSPACPRAKVENENKLFLYETEKSMLAPGVEGILGQMLVGSMLSTKDLVVRVLYSIDS